VRLIHEYQADASAAKPADRKEYSELLLSRVLNTQPQFISNSFSHQTSIKQRIIMLHKTPSKTTARWKYAMVPVMITIVAGFAACTKDFEEKPEVAAAAAQTETSNQTNSSLVEGEKIYDEVDLMPVFNGGKEAMYAYLGENIKYPKEVTKEGVEGTVFIEFVVTKEGKIENAKVLRSVHPALDESALTVIQNMPDWTPGVHKGEQVSVKFKMPIRYELEG